LARALIDSDILIDVLRRTAGTAARLSTYGRSNDLMTTVVNQFEVLRGAASPLERERITALLNDFALIELDEAGASAAAAIHLELRLRGLSIETGDTLIAGIALSRGMAVITRNKRDFERVLGLVVQDL
jgi:tRNA(fMet)-specific endonuclease VapC